MNRVLTKFSDLASSASLQKGTLRSKELYMKLAQSQSEIGNLKVVTEKLEAAAPIRVGQLVTYEYGAKFAEELPYWDKYPLVYVTQVNKDGWHGMNLHYLHPRMRARLFYDMDKRNIPIIDHDMSSLCIKRYLATHVASMPRLFPKDMWDIAVQLPFENFQNAGKQSVWKNTRKKK